MSTTSSSQDHWLELISQCRSSGLTDRQWCIQNGIPISTFYYHVKALRKKACEIPCFLQALFPQKCRLTSSKLHGEFPQYCISSAGTLSGAGEEPLQAYKVY